MAVYFIQGKLGAGKSLAAVQRIFEYLGSGRKVATNFDIYLEKYFLPRKKNTVAFRLPDKPTISDLDAIGLGSDNVDEDTYGALVLDELGTWFNSRSWNQEGRKEVIDWCLHARKLGWDVYFVVQDISIVDTQLRETMCEHLVVMRRLDRLSIPLISPLFKLLTAGNVLRLPKIHVGSVHYGDSPSGLKVDRWIFRGKHFYNTYDTRQVFDSQNNGLSCYLSPWTLKGRYLPPAFTLERLRVSLRKYPEFLYLTVLLSFAAQTVGGSNYIKDQVFILDEARTSKVSENTSENCADNEFISYRVTGRIMQGSHFNYLMESPEYGFLSSDDIFDYKITSKGRCQVDFSTAAGCSYKVRCQPDKDYISPIKKEQIAAPV